MNKDVITGKPISEAALPERFGSSDYNILLVANKYQTGFDQPLLHTMYVDKRLDGVQAVQTLSRLNRMIPGKDAPFVLDFVNEAEDIFRAFKPYFDKTELEEVSDPGALEALKHELDQVQVYYWSEVEAFAQVLYKPAIRERAADHAQLERHLQPAVDRFKLLDHGEQQAFRDGLLGYVRMYGFLSQIIPYDDRELEMLYGYGRFLLPHLQLDRGATIDLGDEVDLQYYRLSQEFSGAIELREGDAERINSPTEVGTGRAEDEQAPLSAIIQLLNERFGTQFYRGGSAVLPTDQRKSVPEYASRTDCARQPSRQVRARHPQADRRFDDRTNGRERQDRNPLYGGSRLSKLGVSGPHARNIRHRPSPLTGGCALRARLLCVTAI
jgi:type I restriction enzyme, R subunit